MPRGDQLGVHERRDAILGNTAPGDLFQPDGARDPVIQKKTEIWVDVGEDPFLLGSEPFEGFDLGMGLLPEHPFVPVFAETGAGQRLQCGDHGPGVLAHETQRLD